MVCSLPYSLQDKNNQEDDSSMLSNRNQEDVPPSEDEDLVYNFFYTKNLHLEMTFFPHLFYLATSFPKLSTRTPTQMPRRKKARSCPTGLLRPPTLTSTSCSAADLHSGSVSEEKKKWRLGCHLEDEITVKNSTRVTQWQPNSLPQRWESVERKWWRGGIHNHFLP